MQLFIEEVKHIPRGWAAPRPGPSSPAPGGLVGASLANPGLLLQGLYTLVQRLPSRQHHSMDGLHPAFCVSAQTCGGTGMAVLWPRDPGNLTSTGMAVLWLRDPGNLMAAGPGLCCSSLPTSPGQLVLTLAKLIAHLGEESGAYTSRVHLPASKGRAAGPRVHSIRPHHCKRRTEGRGLCRVHGVRPHHCKRWTEGSGPARPEDCAW